MLDRLSEIRYNKNTSRLQESPSGMASASQADSGGFDSRFLLQSARFARKKDGRAVLFAFICIWFYARVWKSLASNVTVNSRASPPRETRMVSVSPSRSS